MKTYSAMKVGASGGDSMSFEIRFGVRQGCALSPTLFNYMIDWSNLARLSRGSGWNQRSCVDTQLIQRRLRWIGHAEKRGVSELEAS